MTQLFQRKHRVLIETWRGDTIEIGEDIRVTFRVEQRINDYLWFSEVTIYNLNPSTESDILKNGKSVSLEAGYQDGPYGLLFKGQIRQPIRGKEDGTTYFIKLICLNDMLNVGFCNFVLTGGQTPESIISQIARNSSIPFDVRIGPGLSQQVTSRGKVVVGNPGDELRSIAANNNAFVYIDNTGVVNISPLSSPPPSGASIPSLNAQTGLIGIPQQVDHGVEFRCLINPNIRLDSWVKLNNQDIIQAEIPLLGLPVDLLDRDGIYRVIELVATGDTRGNDWYYDITAIGQEGMLPQMLAAPSQLGI